MSKDAPKELVKTAAKGLEIFVKQAWSIMEAASEKQTPSQYLSAKAVRSIQGKE